MQQLFTEPATETQPEATPTVETAGIAYPTPEPAAPADFEIVMGRAQVASVAFVVLTLIAIAASVFYVAGRMSMPVEPPRIDFTPPDARPGLLRTGGGAPAPTKPAVNPAWSDPVFREPQPGEVFLQMAAVERGVGAVFCEGLRRMGFPSIVAPGPDDRIFRVLIGPIPSSAEMSRIKKSLEDAGLSTFLRRYEAEAKP
jgi:cell division septation protein DedD